MNKTSVIAVLIALLVLAFGGYKASDYFGLGDKANQTQEQNEETQEDHDDHDHSSHDNHDHGTDNSPKVATGTPGEKGKIYQLPVLENLGRRGIGDPNAPVKMQEFFSLTCNHCASFHNDVYPAIKEKYIDTGKIYFILEEFPLNGPALYGSMIARCMPEERYAGFIDLLLTNQDDWAFSGDFKTSLKQNAALGGMGEEEFETCFNNKELQEELATNIKNASENWKVSSTPTFVFNDGERILRGGQTLEQFDRVYEHLIANQE